jgi:hypothetical protein
MDKNKLLRIIEKTLNELYLKDKSIINRKAHEESINHRFGIYFERIINENSDIIYNVDMEYNRNYKEPKEVKINGKKSNIRPDIIAHIRETNDNNLIAIQFKKKYNPNTHSSDMNKIESLFSLPYNYKYGCLIEYLPDEQYFKIEFFENSINNKIVISICK